MRSVLNGLPYPNTLLQAAIRRIKSDTQYRVRPVRAALIKAYLNRYNRFYPNPTYKEVGLELDINNPSVGYQLGRLFAVLEKIQEEANPGINTTIRERYYAAACSAPVTVFANLMRLKNHHLAKLEKGRVVEFEKLLGEIIEVGQVPAHRNSMNKACLQLVIIIKAGFLYKEAKRTRSVIASKAIYKKGRV